MHFQFQLSNFLLLCKGQADQYKKEIMYSCTMDSPDKDGRQQRAFGPWWGSVPPSQ